MKSETNGGWHLTSEAEEILEKSAKVRDFWSPSGSPGVNFQIHGADTILKEGQPSMKEERNGGPMKG